MKTFKGKAIIEVDLGTFTEEQIKDMYNNTIDIKEMEKVDKTNLELEPSQILDFPINFIKVKWEIV